ncbi:MAG: DinB family protein [Lentimicrobium sp.]|nr:DinB family protein [Lentimicrobium sp.]
MEQTHEFEANNQELLQLITFWEPKLLSLEEEVISGRRNLQNRSIREITGHLIDSVSNNTHRIIHLQYQPDPLIFPDYANNGNNDRWIAIQKYQEENWYNLAQLWKFYNLHIKHVINQVNAEKLSNEWITELKQKVSLKSMINHYLEHVRLHLNEIDQLINQE